MSMICSTSKFFPNRSRLSQCMLWHACRLEDIAISGLPCYGMLPGSNGRTFSSLGQLSDLVRRGQRVISRHLFQGVISSLGFSS